MFVEKNTNCLNYFQVISEIKAPQLFVLHIIQNQTIDNNIYFPFEISNKHFACSFKTSYFFNTKKKIQEKKFPAFLSPSLQRHTFNNAFK
jgi:hypothetical protein